MRRSAPHARQRTAFFAAFPVLFACSGGADAPQFSPFSPVDPAGQPPVAANPCGDPEAPACPCGAEGASVDCGTAQERRGDYVICSMGTQVCEQGRWSECMPNRLVQTGAGSTGNLRGLRLKALSGGENCNNLCDPDCIALADTPAGVVVDDDLLADPGGLTLPGGAGGGSCTNLELTPAAATINITQISANGSVTASPATLTVSATCGGVPVQPSWTIDAYDRAVIDEDGALTVFSGIGSPILVTASSTADSTIALVDVVVDVEDRGSNTAVATAFDAAGSSTESGKTLYPYANTVFPLDLEAPLVQWETGGNNATEVQVALRYPAGSTNPSFWYSKIYNSVDPKQGTLSTTGPAWQIPQEIWSAFDRSAAGDATGGEIIIQRRYGSTVRPEMKIPVRFASEPLHGTVYYTQYRRNLSACSGAQSCTYNAASYAPGQTCQVGNVTHPSATPNISMTRAIDLSLKTAPNKDPFNGTAGCPVCHSVSADGSVYVSGNQAWQGSSKGVDTIGLSASGDPLFSAFGDGLAPSYTGLSDNGSSNAAGDPYNNYERTGENSRGFSYAAITPDGSMVLQGPTFWGSSSDTPAANGTQNATLTGIAGHPKPYFFAKTAEPGVGVQFATTGALGPGSVSRSGNVLTPSTNGSLSVDGWAMAANYSVLVKNQSTLADNGVYVVTNAGSSTTRWSLTRRYDADGAGEFKSDMEVRVSDGNSNRGKVLFVATPGTITVNSTGIEFKERSLPGMVFSSAPLSVQYATVAALPAHTQVANVLTANSNGILAVDGVALGQNSSVLVKSEGATSAKHGVYTVTVAGAPSVKWVLTRRGDFDNLPLATSDVSAGLEVLVSSGSTNAGKVFVLHSPATGAVTVNTTAIGFRESALPSMMVPVFSPNGSKIAYVNADADATPGLGDTAWRRGLSMLDFDQATLKVGNKRRLLNNWTGNATNPGIPIKWPFFESDSRSLLYVETEEAEFCSAADSGHSITVNSDIRRACFEAAYGSMSPTTRGYWKGKIWALDTQNPSARVELSKLNDAEDASDADRSYQPTVLPRAVGGYRWVIFTSPRAYGNQFNQKSSSGTPTHFSCAASMLWIAAVDDVTAGTSDRSHPAFLLPGQNMAAITSANHYVNERGYLVPTLCKDEGVSCTSDDECCGSEATPTKTAACRAPASWTPADGPPAKTCEAISGTCSNAGASCSTPDDCCDDAACVDFQCAAPPSFEQASFEREYTAECPYAHAPAWQLLSYYLTTDSDSSLRFSIQAAHEQAELDGAPVLSLGNSTSTVVSPATPEYKDVGVALDAANSNGMNHLRLTVTFVPSTDGQTAPVLHDWEMRYTCKPAQ